MTIQSQQFGELIGTVKALKDNVSKLEGTTETLDTKVDKLISRFDRIDGGWKVLIAVGGLAGTVASVLTAIAMKMWPFLLGSLPKV